MWEEEASYSLVRYSVTIRSLYNIWNMIQLNLGIGDTFSGDLLEKETVTFLVVSAGNVKYLSTGLCERERAVR